MEIIAQTYPNNKMVLNERLDDLAPFDLDDMPIFDHFSVHFEHVWVNRKDVFITIKDKCVVLNANESEGMGKVVNIGNLTPSTHEMQLLTDMAKTLDCDTIGFISFVHEGY